VVPLLIVSMIALSHLVEIRPSQSPRVLADVTAFLNIGITIGAVLLATMLLCTRYGVTAPAEFDDPFADPVIGSVPQDWLESLPGQVLLAVHVGLRPAPGSRPPSHPRSTNWPSTSRAIPSRVAGGAYWNTVLQGGTD
jgi:uncharacterized protein DUF3422